MINPLFLFLVFFVGAPLVELYLLIEVGSVIGALPTILLSVFTAILGGALVRLQGFSILFRAQSQMANDELPAIEMLEGVVLLLVGLALLLPGFITDAIGFLLLVPPLRQGLVNAYLARMIVPPGPGGPGPHGGTRADSSPRGPRTIEGEFHREDD